MSEHDPEVLDVQKRPQEACRIFKHDQQRVNPVSDRSHSGSTEDVSRAKHFVAVGRRPVISCFGYLSSYVASDSVDR